MPITLDFETRSHVNLKQVGNFNYAAHPSTQVLCMCWKYSERQSDAVHLWHRGHPSIGIYQKPTPTNLIARIKAGELVWAHNAIFEYLIWNGPFRAEFPEFPELPLEQMRCTAATAAQFALPRDLDTLTQVLGLRHLKDPRGKKALAKLSRPRRRKGEYYWLEEREELRILWEYCGQDVRAEEGVHRFLPSEMSEDELALWQMDLRMNLRGIRVDVEGVRTAIELARRAAQKVNDRIYVLTDGWVQKGTAREALKLWCREEGEPIPNTQAKVLEDLIRTKHFKSKLVEEVIKLSLDVNRSSIAKYKKILQWVSDDGRARGLMMYFGAERTGRWSGKGIQPHNFIRGFSKLMDTVWEVIHLGDIQAIEILFGSAMKALAEATRGALTADEDKELVVADFSAIEARVLLWVAFDEKGLDIFRRGEDIYLYMAEDIYGLKGLTKDGNPKERFMGKKAVLGLGYQMGDEKFDDECAKEGVDNPREFYTHVVKVYRTKTFPSVPKVWRAYEEGAIHAVLTGERVETGRVSWFKAGRFLHCELPSGRKLSYLDPRVRTTTSRAFPAINKYGKPSKIRVIIKDGESDLQIWRRAARAAELGEKKLIEGAEWEEIKKPALWYMGRLKSGSGNQWGYIPTYGGGLTENVVQAIARDLLAAAMLRVDRDDMYELLLSVHDEVIAESWKGNADLRAFENLVSVIPSWAEGLPVAAEGWIGFRYRK